MKAKPQITISEPCNQNWETMEKRNGHNFCEACNKCVTDFSTYSNAEIINALSNSKTEICGRLSQTQLNQLNYRLMLAPKNRNWMKYLGVLAIGAGVFTQNAHAITSKYPTEINKTFATNNVDEQKPLNVKIISGYVFDENKKPLAGIRVVILNTKLFALTDEKGRYEIKLHANFDFKNTNLVVQSVRYSGTLNLNYTKIKQDDFVLPKMETMIMGLIAINKSSS